MPTLRSAKIVYKPKVVSNKKGGKQTILVAAKTFSKNNN